MTGSSLRVAVLGAGYFSRFHHESWARMGRAELVGVADHRLERAAQTGHPAFGSLEQMLERTRPDIVDIVIPPAGHGDAIKTALAFGVRAIICQKPFCADLSQAREMTARARAAGIPLIVHENFRFQPWYRRIAQAMGEGRIGSPLQATFRLRPGDGQGPRAYLDRQPYFRQMPRLLIHETGVHWIDTFRFLFGMPVAVYADLRRINPAIAGEDAGYVLFDHPGGVRALFDGNRHLDHAADNTRRTMGEALIEGTQGTLSLGGGGAVTLRAFGDPSVQTLLAPDSSPGFGGDCVHRLQSHVVAGVLDEAPFENRAENYLAVMEVEQAIYRSAETGLKVVLAN